MVWLPRLNDDTPNDAVAALLPLLTKGTSAITVVPSWNVTVPEGVFDPAGVAATVAANETACPTVDGFGAEVSVVADALACTFWTRVALPPPKLESPLYVAVMK